MPKRTVFYAPPSQHFERSLDVYSPTSSPGTDHTPPLVIMVVGSGWIGHRAGIYRVFDWWNAAGPATVASVGCTCVCVRHRGAFPRPPPAAIAFALACAAALAGCFPRSVCVLLLYGAWLLAARGAATHGAMMDDVAQALVWVRSHRAELAPPDAKLIIGGYSSGGHVAVSLLQRPEKLAHFGLPPAAGCDGILLLSGVLATRAGPPLTGTASP